MFRFCRITLCRSLSFLLPGIVMCSALPNEYFFRLSAAMTVMVYLYLLMSFFTLTSAERDGDDVFSDLRNAVSYRGIYVGNAYFISFRSFLPVVAHRSEILSMQFTDRARRLIYLPCDKEVCRISLYEVSVSGVGMSNRRFRTWSLCGDRRFERLFEACSRFVS